MKMMFISFCCSRKGFRLFVQAAKQQAVWLSLNCVNGKYLWALPTPTTFEKVDQTFILNCQINLLNHNLLLLPQHLEQNHKNLSITLKQTQKRSQPKLRAYISKYYYRKIRLTR